MALIALTGCEAAAEPTPSPTPTGFASEEEAFAAAEETYRAYVDALNDVDLEDPATFEPVFALLTGEALAASKKELTGLHAREVSKTGETKIASIRPQAFDSNSGTITLDVCLDVSDVDIRTEAGDSIVPPGRNDSQLLRALLAAVADPVSQLLITSSSAIGDEPCA